MQSDEALLRAMTEPVAGVSRQMLVLAALGIVDIETLHAVRDRVYQLENCAALAVNERDPSLYRNVRQAMRELAGHVDHACESLSKEPLATLLQTPVAPWVCETNQRALDKNKALQLAEKEKSTAALKDLIGVLNSAVSGNCESCSLNDKCKSANSGACEEDRR